jgi:RNA polymerase sigma-70 factor (ECF subfamily)
LGVRRIGLPVEDLSDEVLLTGFGAGDEELSIAFVRRFQAKVFGVCLAVTGDRDAAEDVAQQAFERAWRHAKAYDPVRGSVGTWLGAIARNGAIDAIRVRTPVPVDADELLAHLGASPIADSPERMAKTHEEADLLRRAIRSLPAEQARAVVLAGIAGLSASEVAASEQIPLGTAKTRIRTAMHRLRGVLIDAGGEYG